MKRLINGAVLVLFAINTQAALLTYEGFDYSGTTLSGKNGGTGWNGVWIDGEPDFSHLSDDGVSLNSAAFPFTPVGSRIEGSGGNTQRAMDSTVDFSVDGVRYFSLMMSKSTASASDEAFLISMVDMSIGGSGRVRGRFGMSTGDEFYAQAALETAATAGTVVAGVNYFMVVKLETLASADDIMSLKAYAPADTVDLSDPVDWTLVATGGSGVDIDMLRLTIGENATGSLDEFRMGDEWADVAVVPEPATMFLFGSGLIGGVLARRKRRI